MSSSTKNETSRFNRLVALTRLEHANLWMKFLLALVGLALAFAAALFSTVSRESGNVWATLVLASTALILATLVGLTTVPHLARRVVVTRLRDAVDYEVTRAGIIYVVGTLLIGIAALNTGNNLLHIVVAAMLSAILVSGIISALVLRHLELDVRLPEHVLPAGPFSDGSSCGQPAPVFAVILHPRGRVEEKEVCHQVAVGTRNLRLSAQASARAAVGAVAGSASPAHRARRGGQWNFRWIRLLSVCGAAD